MKMTAAAENAVVYERKLASRGDGRGGLQEIAGGICGQRDEQCGADGAADLLADVHHRGRDARILGNTPAVEALMAGANTRPSPMPTTTRPGSTPPA